MKNQIGIDIKPEFDKFIDNPYPRVSTMLNTSRPFTDSPSHLNISKSTHPFSKYANPLSRADINPASLSPKVSKKDDFRTNITIRTFNENENPFNPFNKVGIRETLDLTLPTNDNKGKFDRSLGSENTYILTNPYQHNTINDNSVKHRFLETDMMSQNLHPNSSLQHYNSIMNSTNGYKDRITLPNEVKKLDIPKASTTKMASLKFCSSKKKKSNSRGRKKVAQSSKVSTRFKGEKLIQSTDSLPIGFKAKDMIPKSSLLSEYTHELLSKYENENKGNQTVLTSKDRLLLTQKALSPSRAGSQNDRQNYGYSASPTSLIDSSRICRPLLPFQKENQLKSNATEV